MAAKEKPDNINTNNNTNNVNVNVHVPARKRSPSKKKNTPGWYTKTILGGIIALILSISGYYIKKNMDDKGKDNGTVITSDGHPIEGKKQN